jgi:hypothetical protein
MSKQNTVSVTFDGKTFTRMRQREFTHALCCRSPKYGSFVCTWHTSEDAADKACRKRTNDKYDASGAGSQYFVVATN